MELKHIVQSTPNPSAQKFIFNKDVKAMGKASFSRDDDYSQLILINALFLYQDIIQLHFYENIITVTKENKAEWQPLQDEIIKTVRDNIDQHDIFFEKKTTEKQRPTLPTEWQEIDDILDEAIRPSLQRDGGDLIINNYLEQENILVVEYEGACVTCPSSTVGTLLAIKNVLMERWNPKIKVITLEQFNQAMEV